jgi:molecular chaperone DnaK (HSP70)
VARYVIGIDLGTTNTALAFVDLERKPGSKGPEVQTFQIPQLVAPGELGNRPLLPSFLYLPGEHDLPPKAVALPWDLDRRYTVGEFARNHGARVPGRLVTSAKSWLSHGGVDRSAPLLPWTAPHDVQRISPIEASTRYLHHLADSWNYAEASGRPEDRLENQAIILTAPASFDDVARNLTVEAARKAGFENLTLLEEPQAAFYCWLVKHSQAEAGRLRPGSICLVADVGGGTTDFSLIRAVEVKGEFGFVREAVGDHLLLGGDNMDLALAKGVEGRLPGAGRLDAAQYGMLTQACRTAKEVLLGEKPPESYTVTVMGRGRLVIGGAQHAKITRDDVRSAIFEHFLPVVPFDSEPVRGPSEGLHEMGLPYVSDPAISRHLARFLRRHLGGKSPDNVNTHAVPQAVLFNGGVFQPAALRQRLVEVMHRWFDRPGQPWRPLVLTNPSLDLAVAWGAAYYGWLRHTGGRRIGGGSARSYYIGIDVGRAQDGPPAGAIPVLCVVPQHLEEGSGIVLDKPELELALGQPVSFPLYTSTVRGDDQPGQIFNAQPDQLLQLPPLHTILRGGKRSGSKRVPVTLAAHSTEVGTLELWCAAKDGQNRWRLEFNVRDIVKGDEPSTPESESLGITEGPKDVWPEAQIQEAARLVHSAYEDTQPPLEPSELTKALERVLEARRAEWPTGLCRRLWDFLSAVADKRRRSPGHLSRWYHLTGYSLRPGFGDPVDKYRVEQLWKLIQTPPRNDGRRAPAQPVAEGGADYWIMWRRVAGGLNVTLQQSLYDRMKNGLLPGKTKGGPKPAANELAEIWRTAASLERLDGKYKELLGQTLVKSLRRSPVPTYGFWALTRLGARTLLYGPLNAIVHRQTAERWLDALIGFKPGHESERLAWMFCLAQLARRTGQRALDIDDNHCQSVLAVLGSNSAPAHWRKMVEEVSQLEADEETQMFGESLPIGLRLLGVND